jgi:uncharacterized protein with HEPN domain
MNEKSRKAIIKIIVHAEKATGYASCLDNWVEDSKTLEAVVFNLAQIGELVRFVDTDLQNEFNHINWAAMKGLRNRIIHDYDCVIPVVIRKIVETDLPKLVSELRNII